MTRHVSQLELLLVALTKREFSLVWSCDFLKESEEYGEEFSGIDEHGTPGFDGRGDLWVERLRRVIRWLSREHGWAWEWIEVEGTSIRRVEEWCEPGNAAYEAALMMNQVHPAINLLRAAELARSKDLGLWKVFEAAAHDVGEAMDYRATTADPEVRKAWEKHADELLESMGVVRLNKEPAEDSVWKRLRRRLNSLAT